MDFRFIIRRKSRSSLHDVFSGGRSENERNAVAYAALSDKGSYRDLNEDAYGVFPDDSFACSGAKGQLFIVADGMGGHISGQEASEMAIQTISAEYFKDSSMGNSECLARAFQLANSRIHKESGKRELPQVMGTTCSALVLAGNTAQIAHVGDSRIYRIREDKVEQITQDHAEAADLVRAGLLRGEETLNYPRRSAINRALGVEAEVDIEIHRNISLKERDCFILCTDGLATIAENEIYSVVRHYPIREACRRLIEISRRLGSHDNATVIVLKLNKEIS